MKTQITALVLIALVALTATAAAMPMSSCTPEQIGKILVQPLRDTASAYKTMLIAGDISEDQYYVLMNIHLVYVKAILVIVEAIRDSPLMDAREKMDALLKVLPWRVR